MRASARWLLPLSAGCALLFAWRLPSLWPLVPLGQGVEPATQVRAATAFLAGEGLDLRGHQAAARVSVDELALDHADSLLGRHAALGLAERAWVAGALVTYKRRGDPDVVRAWVTSAGRVARWSRSLQDDTPAGASDSATAAARAGEALARVEHRPDAPSWTVTGVAVRERPARVDRTFTLERRWSSSPELKERAVVTVAGDRVAGVVRALVVPDPARRARLAALAPTQALASFGYLLVGGAVVAAFALLLLALRDGSARLGGPGAVAALVFAGVVATEFLDPAQLLDAWEPLWPWVTVPLTLLQGIGLTNAWLALVLFTAIVAGDAEDRRSGAGRGATLWRLLRGGITDPAVGAAAWHGWLVGFCCGGVLAAATWGIAAATGGATALQPRGFFVKVLDAWSPSLTALLFFTAVALAEELGYRFFLGSWIARVTGRRWVAIWAPAVVYGLSHTALDFLPSAGPAWGRPLVLTLVGATWGWAFFRFDALTVVLSHLTADLFIFNWPRLASGDWALATPAALVVLVPLVPAVAASVASVRTASRARSRRAAFPLPLLAAALLAAGACGPATPAATLIVRHARVWTGDTTRPWAEAVAVRGDTVVAVGDDSAVARLAGADTRVIDAGGGMVTPGFIDSHVHFLGGGFGLAAVQLRDAATPAEFTRRIAAYAKTVPPGTWILRGDWDHQLWGGTLPTRAWIDSVTPRHPVLVNRLDGHMVLANSAAMRAAGIGDDVQDVPGGTIVRDASGRPTGVFKDNATALLEPSVTPPTPAAWQAAIDTAMAYVSARGVTMVHHVGPAGVGSAWDELAALRRAQAAGPLRTRFRVAVGLADWARLRDTIAARGPGDDWIRIGMLKGFVDGSLGSHTAAMLAPFSDAPWDSGFLVTSPDSLLAWTRGADAAGLQVAVHAIGDRAIRLQLDVFERVAREHGPRDRRFRIEHAQHIAPPEFARFAALGVIASMQPYHAADDGRWAERVIGPVRSRGTYAFRSLRDAGATLAFGSDWSVAPPTPLEGIMYAVTRQTLDGAHPGGWQPQERITVEDALRAYTTGASRAGFTERSLGMLRPGMLADLVVLDRDLTAIPPETIGRARVRVTVVGGRVVYEAR